MDIVNDLTKFKSMWCVHDGITSHLCDTAKLSNEENHMSLNIQKILFAEKIHYYFLIYESYTCILMFNLIILN